MSEKETNFSEWERLEAVLRSNNEKLIEKIELVLASHGLGQASLDVQGMDASVPEEFWQPLSAASSETSETSESSQKPRRKSFTSLNSGDEKCFRENLVKEQRLANRKAHGRGSAFVVQNSLMHQTRRIVASWVFEAFFATAILSNSLLIGVQVHYAAKSAERGDPLPAAFFVVEQIYAVLFLIELVMRILAEGMPFFWSSPNVAWNYLDVLIILTSVLNLISEVASMNQVNADAADAIMSGNVRIIRILRVTRVIRVVRVVKIVRFIRALRSLVHSIFGTLKVLMWSVLLLLMIIYCFAIVFTDVSTDYIHFDEISQVDRDFLKLRFPDLERSMHTLFQSICNGITWGEVADNMHSLSWVLAYLYVIYVAFCIFAVLNVMTGVFCQSAIESAERDQELHLQAVEISKKQQLEMFTSVFESIQRERGKLAGQEEKNITYVEFEELVNEPHVRSFFQSLDVETNDAWTLFKLMDTSGNGDLDAAEFVEGCMRLKGPARSMDVSLLMQEQKRLRKKLTSMEQLLLEVRRALGRSSIRSLSTS